MFIPFYPILSYVILSCLILFYLSYVILSCLILIILCYLILSYLILSCLILSYLMSSYLILSYQSNVIPLPKFVLLEQCACNPENDVEDCDGSNKQEPEPHDHVHLLYVQVDGQCTLHGVSLLVTQATHPEVTHCHLQNIQNGTCIS